jgi:hypothetical protein
MKKLLVTMSVMLVCAGAAFGQGSVSFSLDTTHAIYFTADTAYMLPGDAHTMVQSMVIAGQGAYTGQYNGANGTIAALAGSPTFVAALYGGPNASSLTLQTTTTIGNSDFEGMVNATPCYPAGIPGGTVWTWEVQVFSGINPLLGTPISQGAAAAWKLFDYAGDSGSFLATLGAAVPSHLNDTAPYASGGAGSTWAPGTAQLTDYLVSAGGPFGGIQVYALVPEPGTFALVGLGLAALLVLRRRS